MSRRKMNNFVEKSAIEVMVDEVEKAVEYKLFLSALHMALSIPDVLGKIEYRTGNRKEKYIKWFDEFVKNDFGMPYYGSFGKDESQPQFDGRVCYNLRCSLFHELSNKMSENDSNELIVDEFVISLDGREFYTGNFAGSELIKTPQGWKQKYYLYFSARDLSSKIALAAKTYVASHPEKDYPKVKMNYGGAKAPNWLQ